MPEGDDTIDEREARVRLGDRQALAELFAEQQDRLKRWIGPRIDPRLRGRLSASDVVQDVFLAAEQRLEHFGGLAEMPFAVWVRLIAGQRLTDAHRRHLGAAARDAGREQSVSAGPKDGSTAGSLAARFVADLTSPSRAAVRAEIVDQLGQAILGMEPLDREVLTLRHFDELTNDEVAARLGIPKGTASKRYVRALGRLREILERIPGLVEPDGRATPAAHGGDVHES